ncbi:hypothetical protein V6N13_149359 [Hibiscus sabdariffa]|uniref:Uncharacterized protein n=1 Tax=Hibiscus sabdariffa TaxID=183260 RepID=A0ABR2EHH9_9ROSI
MQATTAQSPTCKTKHRHLRLHRWPRTKVGDEVPSADQNGNNNQDKVDENNIRRFLKFKYKVLSRKLMQSKVNGLHNKTGEKGNSIERDENQEYSPSITICL